MEKKCSLPKKVGAANRKQPIPPKRKMARIIGAACLVGTLALGAVQVGCKEPEKVSFSFKHSYGEEEENHDELLIKALGRGQLKKAERMIFEGADPNAGLQWMCGTKRKNTQAVKLMIEYGADVNLGDIEGLTPLTHAVAKGNLPVVKMLLAHGADPNLQNKLGGSALVGAALLGHTHIAEILLAHGADPNQEMGDGPSALIAASAQGHSKIARLLIKRGADLEYSFERKTALEFAAGNGKLGAVRELIKAGAINVSAPLRYASEKGHLAVGRELIKNGAWVNWKDEDGDAPLILASRNGHGKFARMLIQNGADVNTENEYGATAAMYAAGHLDVSLMRILVKKGANLKATDSGGDSALNYIGAYKAQRHFKKEKIIEDLLISGGATY